MVQDSRAANATIRMSVTEVSGEPGYAAVGAVDGVPRPNVPRTGLVVTDVGLSGSMNERQLADTALALLAELSDRFAPGLAEDTVVGRRHRRPGMHVISRPFAGDALPGRIRGFISS
ncbi:hypothetical protein VQH23_12415 [Pararoseomonas sp. SCSIO 73927]|uniref:hypothetical protein n=1 Tax=Pararoseomonas sp. SCSIO 73927 TaxID=3114537 RepID=UPI0030D061B6